MGGVRPLYQTLVVLNSSVGELRVTHCFALIEHKNAEPCALMAKQEIRFERELVGSIESFIEHLSLLVCVDQFHVGLRHTRSKSADNAWLQGIVGGSLEFGVVHEVRVVAFQGRKQVCVGEIELAY